MVFGSTRGLAAGLTAAGFGVGSALTVIPIQGMIASGGYETAFLHFGLGQGMRGLRLGVQSSTGPHSTPGAAHSVRRQR
jgi:OFA family oxalate/formate antiporter-like MFS transporter